MKTVFASLITIAAVGTASADVYTPQERDAFHFIHLSNDPFTPGTPEQHRAVARTTTLMVNCGVEGQTIGEVTGEDAADLYIDCMNREGIRLDLVPKLSQAMTRFMQHKGAQS